MKLRINSKGFTLTEILIVVVILGIMAGIAIPRFFPQAEKGRVSEAIGILGAIRQGEEAYLLDQGTYCDPNTAGDCQGDWGGLGMDPPAGRYFTYDLSNISATTFTATATRTADSARGVYDGNTISIDETGAYGGNHPFTPN